MKQSEIDGRDGGLAWCVALAACFINFVTAGIGRMSGIMYVAFIDMFGVSRGLATTPFSIRSSTRNLLGPAVGILGQHYGVRRVTVLGSILGLFSSASCYFATNINWIIIVWGGINGIGVACTSTLPQVVVSQYFDKHLTTAVGLAISGACVGSFLFPALIEFLLHKYGLQGTFLLMTGITMHVLPAAMLLRKPPWVKAEAKRMALEAEKQKAKQAEGDSDTKNQDTKAMNKINKSESQTNDQGNKIIDNTRPPSTAYRRTSTKCNHLLDNRNMFPELLFEAMKFYGSNSKDSYSKQYASKEFNDTEKDLILLFLNKMYRHVFKRSSFDKRDSIDGYLQRLPKMEVSSDFADLVATAIQQFYDEAVIKKFIIHLENRNLEFSKSESPTKLLTVIFELIEVHKLYSLAKSKIADFAVVQLEPKLDRQKDYYYQTEKKSKPEPAPPPVEETGVVKYLKTAAKLNANPIFTLICVCRALHFITFNPVITAVVDFGMDKGLPIEYGKYIIAALSAGDLVGRLCMGWITDRGYIKLPTYMALTMVIQGVVTASLPWMWNSWSILSMIAIFGLLEGSIYVRHPVLISKYVRSEHRPIAMGSLNFLTGLIGFAIPAYIGYFRDTLGAYDRMFYLTGSLGASAGLAWIAEPHFVRWSPSNLKPEEKPLPKV